MNNTITNLLSNQSQKEIRTDRLQVQGNVLKVDKNTLQLSNISTLSHGRLKVNIPYPLLIIWLLISLIILKFSFILGLILIIALGVYIYYLYQKTLNTNSYLYIQLNSGIIYPIYFKEESFLLEVQDVLETAFNQRNQNISINIKDQTIVGDNNSIAEHSIGNNNIIESNNTDKSFSIGEINNSSLEQVQLGHGNHANIASNVSGYDWDEISKELERVINNISISSSVKSVSIEALEAAKNKDISTFETIVKSHKAEFLSELFINFAGSLLTQVVTKILGMG